MTARVIVCSFVQATGSALIGSRTWRWEFHEYLGPTFVDARGEPIKNQPGDNHPVWPHFNRWLAERNAKKKEKSK